MTKISIILPVYNGEKFISQSIDSVIKQTEPDWELIIVNDCSTDRTSDIIAKFAEKDKRIKIINNKSNKKLPASLNIGFSRAEGKYLTWTSDDNLYKNNALYLMSRFLDENRNKDMVVMNEEYIDANGKVIGVLTDDYNYKRCVEGLMIGCNVGAAFLYRKELAEKIGKYAEDLFCAEDYDYWCRVAIAGEICYTNDVIYQYRVHDASLSKTKKELVKINTIKVKLRYCKKFFEKYKFTALDRIKFYAALPIIYSPTPYKFPILIIKLYNLMVETMVGVLLVLSSKIKRRNVRRKFYINNEYSMFVR